jgi:hypothetical protein
MFYIGHVSPLSRPWRGRDRVSGSVNIMNIKAGPVWLSELENSQSANIHNLKWNSCWRDVHFTSFRMEENMLLQSSSSDGQIWIKIKFNHKSRTSITVAAPSKLWNVFDRPSTKIVGSNPIQGMDVCASSLFVLLCIGNWLATGLGCSLV